MEPGEYADHYLCGYGFDYVLPAALDDTIHTHGQYTRHMRWRISWSARCLGQFFLQHDVRHVTRTEAVKILGVSPVTARRHLRVLSEMGAVRIQRKKIEILWRHSRRSRAVAREYKARRRLENVAAMQKEIANTTAES